MPVPHTEWTVDRVLALPDDGNRYELLDGELAVTPAPSLIHQVVVRELQFVLAPYLRRWRLGEVLASPADIVFSPRRLVQPDVFVMPWTEPRVQRWADVRALRLAVEVLSPGTAHTDRTRKRRLYQSEGVGEYWIVDADARVVERWRPSDLEPEILRDVLSWQPEAAVPALRIALPPLFAEVWGERGAGDERAAQEAGATQP